MARRALTAACLAAAALVASGCGSKDVQLAKDDPDYHAAQLFAEKCGGCHTFEAAGTQGSAVDVKDRERIDGPHFDKRQEDAPDVLLAIANGGFSGAIMPENIITGPEAQAVAQFLEKHSGKKRPGVSTGG